MLKNWVFFFLMVCVLVAGITLLGGGDSIRPRFTGEGDNPFEPDPDDETEEPRLVEVPYNSCEEEPDGEPCRSDQIEDMQCGRCKDEECIPVPEGTACEYPPLNIEEACGVCKKGSCERVPDETPCDGDDKCSWCMVGMCVSPCLECQVCAQGADDPNGQETGKWVCKDNCLNMGYDCSKCVRDDSTFEDACVSFCTYPCHMGCNTVSQTCIELCDFNTDSCECWENGCEACELDELCQNTQGLGKWECVQYLVDL